MNRDQVIRECVQANNRRWPEQLTSGVMFYRGERITQEEFTAAVARLDGRTKDQEIADLKEDIWSLKGHVNELNQCLRHYGDTAHRAMTTRISDLETDLASLSEAVLDAELALNRAKEIRKKWGLK